MTNEFKAFLSYSRADDKCANWLHRKLDGYRTPEQLVGDEGEYGPVAPRLFPIFRDRSDLSSGGALSDKISDALKRSEALIVLCSPAAAKSKWVNEEIERFIALGREDRIYPVIADDLPRSANVEQSFFPPALHGRGLLAADLREITLPSGKIVGDGRHGGRLKLIAGVLGVALNDLIRREVHRQRRTIFALSVSGLIVTAIAIAAIVGFILADLQKRRAERNFETALEGVDTLIEDFANEVKYFENVPNEVVANIAQKAEQITLNLGNVSQDPSLQHRVAKTRSAIGQMQHRIGDHQTAIETLEYAIENLEVVVSEDSDDLERRADLVLAKIRLAMIYKVSNNWTLALDLFDAAIEDANNATAKDSVLRHLMAEADINLGDLRINSDPAQSKAHYKRAISRLQTLQGEGLGQDMAIADIAHAELALSDLNIHFFDQPERAKALSLSAHERLRAVLEHQPENTQWREWHAKVLEQIGYLSPNEGERRSYLDEAQNMHEDIVESHPRDLQRRRALAFYFLRTGDKYVELGDEGSAREQYTRAASTFAIIILSSEQPLPDSIDTMLNAASYMSGPSDSSGRATELQNTIARLDLDDTTSPPKLTGFTCPETSQSGPPNLDPRSRRYARSSEMSSDQSIDLIIRAVQYYCTRRAQ